MELTEAPRAEHEIIAVGQAAAERVERSPFRKVLVAAGLSLILIAVYCYPDVRFILGMGDEYRGIAMTGIQDEMVYLARLKALYKGHPWTLSDVHNRGHAGDPWVLGFLGENFEAAVGRALGLSVVQLDLLMSALMPVLIFWLCWRLTVDLGGGQRVGLIAAGAIVFGYYWLSPNLVQVMGLLTGQGKAPALWFQRPISPQFNHVLLLATLIATWRALLQPGWGWVAAAGVLFGSLFYSFVYYWTFIAAGVGLYGLMALVRRERPAVIRCGAILFLGGLLSIPFWQNMLAVLNHPAYGYLEMRQGVVHTRAAVLPWVHIGLIAAIGLVALLCRAGRPARFALAFLLGGLLCLNQQLLTGRLLQPGHWQNYSNKTMLIIAAAAAVGWLVSSGRLGRFTMLARRGGLMTGAVLALLILAATIQQTQYYDRWKGHYADWQHLAAPLEWLSSHTSKDSVVLTDPLGWFGEGRPFSFNNHDLRVSGNGLPSRADTSITEREVLVYSHNSVYLPPKANALITEEEFRHRYLAALHFLGYSEEEILRFIRFGGGLFFRGMEALLRPDEVDLERRAVRSAEEAYQRIRQKDPVASLRPYRADYVLVAQQSKAASRLVDLRHQLENVYADGRFIIYRIKAMDSND